MSKHEKIIEKIRKLLALSKSSNEHEAALAASHAHRLLAEHNLTISDTEVTSMSVADTVSVVKTKSHQSMWNLRLLNAVCKAFDCEFFADGGRGVVTFVGVGADPEVASFTYQYLFATVTKLARKYRKDIKESDKARGNFAATSQRRREQKYSYLIGCAVSIEQTLQKTKAEMPVTCTALVPVKDALIKQTMEDNGVIYKTKNSKQQMNDAAFIKGLSDGAKIQINKGITDTTTEAERLAA